MTTKPHFNQLKNNPIYIFLFVVLMAALILKIGYEIGYAGYEFGQWLKAR